MMTAVLSFLETGWHLQSFVVPFSLMISRTPIILLLLLTPQFLSQSIPLLEFYRFFKKMKDTLEEKIETHVLVIFHDRKIILNLTPGVEREKWFRMSVNCNEKHGFQRLSFPTTVSTWSCSKKKPCSSSSTGQTFRKDLDHKGRTL